MAWRMARSLDKLLAEINARSPHRSRLSDGGIGDEAHASRDSDHNPWVRDGAVGVVTARDFTNDPDGGFNAPNFANWLRARCKSCAARRVKYIISERRICSGTRDNWAWRPYSGPNAHLKHVHVSVLATQGRYDDERSWGWQPAAPVKVDIQEDDVTPADRKAIAEQAAELVLDGIRDMLLTDRMVPNQKLKATDPAAKDMTIVGVLSNIELNQDQQMVADGTDHKAVVAGMGEIKAALSSSTPKR